MDGSISARSIGHERRALNKVKSDLLAVLLLIALTGNWLAFFVHYQVIPIPIAAIAASEFDPDKENWKQNIRNAGVDEAFQQWSVQRAHVDRSAVESQQQTLWLIWPWIIMVLLGWVVGSAIFLRRAYYLIIRSYARGVSNRAEQYMNRDIGRLQDGVAWDQHPSVLLVAECVKHFGIMVSHPSSHRKP